MKNLQKFVETASASELPYIAWLATFSIDPGILISLYASAHCPYTTLATSEWIISWPGDPMVHRVAAILFSSHPYM